MHKHMSLVLGLICLLAGAGMLLVRVLVSGRLAEPLPVLVTVMGVAGLLAGVALLRRSAPRRE